MSENISSDIGQKYSRRHVLGMLVSTSLGILACSENKPKNDGVLEYAEALNLSEKIEFRNESRLVDLSIDMSKIDILIGTRAGLSETSGLILVKFVDKADPKNTSGGLTSFYGKKKQSESEIAVPNFVNILLKETHIANSPLISQERKFYYLSVLLSKATLVEISNQARNQKYNGIPEKEFQALGDQIDVESNQLGNAYLQQIINGTAQPFVIVRQIHQRV